MASTFTPTVITSNSGVNNVFTNIPLANSATTTIQNISTFANGEGGVLTGVIKIDATTDYVFGFEISFTKDTAGVINHSVRYFAGDIPTLALFTIGVSGQDIQITLGTHAGFVNSSARFQMMASAASPGVQVSARNVTGDTTGTAPGAGLIGEKIEATITGATITSASYVSISSNLVLPSGVWFIVYNVSAKADAVGGASPFSQINISVALSTAGSAVAGSDRNLHILNPYGATTYNPTVGSTLSHSQILVLSASTTYIVVAKKTVGAGSGSTFIDSVAPATSNFYAIRIA